VQYQLPQFVEAEDKIFGPLTLKQFLYILGAGGLLFLFWSVFQVSVWFFLFAIPIVLFTLIITFGQYQGRPAVKYLLPLFQFLFSDREYVFHRTFHQSPVHASLKRSTKETQGSMGQSGAEPPQSRLKRLAYVLDQRAREEEELLKQAHM
jgi:hypothetical protein